MAVEDLKSLKEQLPEVFDDKAVPESWDDEWIIVPIEDPEKGIHHDGQAESHRPGIEDLVVEVNRSNVDYSVFAAPPSKEDSAFDWGPDYDLPSLGGSAPFPGGPARKRDTNFYPPPDAFAFYLPFHFFYPKWWGIYLVLEPTLQLANFVSNHAGGALSSAESLVATRIFLYGHEAFHHAVESFSTRLEVTHREVLYKAGFTRVYLRTLGTDDCVEEALANAHGLRLVKKRAFPRDKVKRAAAVASFETFIKGCPPGYRRGLEFVSDGTFNLGRFEFAEENHREALKLAPKDPALWSTFPHAFSGISRVTSRVNYLVRRDSLLATRLDLDLRYLRYRDLRRKLIDLADCHYVREGKGGHEIWKSRQGHHFPVPRHPGDLRKGTLAKIIKEAGLQMSVTQFINARP